LQGFSFTVNGLCTLTVPFFYFRFSKPEFPSVKTIRHFKTALLLILKESASAGNFRRYFYD
jgi:hypothetical protein